MYDSAAGTACLFVNGTRIAAGNVGPYRGKAPNLDASRSAALMVGNRFNGAIDDIMLFGSALSTADIRAIYASAYGAYFDAPADVYRVTNLKDSGPGSLREGIETQWTRSGPSASAARAATSAESIPPERPSTTSPKPFLRT